jgi:hypothetical protein
VLDSVEIHSRLVTLSVVEVIMSVHPTKLALTQIVKDHVRRTIHVRLSTLNAEMKTIKQPVAAYLDTLEIRSSRVTLNRSPNAL